MTNQKNIFRKGKDGFTSKFCFFCFFGFPRKGVWFLVSGLQKPTKMQGKDGFLVQNNLFPCVFCFWRSETKKPNTLARETKKNKKNQGKPKNQNFEVKAIFSCSKDGFLVSGLFLEIWQLCLFCYQEPKFGLQILNIC